MRNQTLSIRPNLAALAAAAFIGAVSVTTGPAAAESTLGDQSFERGGGSAVIGQPTEAATGEDQMATGSSAKLPEGVRIQLVAEYSSDIPGVQKVQLRKVTLEPGATLGNFTVADPLFCNATAGTISVFDHAKGTTAVYRSGDHWSFARGQFTLSNPGDVDHVHYLYAMIQSQGSTALRSTPGTENWEPSGSRGSGYTGKI